MAERKVQVPYMGKMVDGMDVPITESNERWSEITLEDGTMLRVKQSVAAVVRLDGQYDLEGNPMYFVKSAPSVAIVQVSPKLRRVVQ
ncbi:MAG: hypothetical protein WCE23_05750 [Candidatus Binatus sp.]|uniref:hypothetical protein n=1 Tax=Candidatus Binatus sp. TaxID=2811406 RepID=UPI003C709319